MNMRADSSDCFASELLFTLTIQKLSTLILNQVTILKSVSPRQRFKYNNAIFHRRQRGGLVVLPTASISFDGSTSILILGGALLHSYVSVNVSALVWNRFSRPWVTFPVIPFELKQSKTIADRSDAGVLLCIVAVILRNGYTREERETK